MGKLKHVTRPTLQQIQLTAMGELFDERFAKSFCRWGNDWLLKDLAKGASFYRLQASYIGWLEGDLGKGCLDYDQQIALISLLTTMVKRALDLGLIEALPLHTPDFTYVTPANPNNKLVAA